MDRKSENAVSPVIGVVLMVAITVILAAVITTFVFGMATNIPATKNLAITVQCPDADHIVVTYQGGSDASSLSYALMSVTESDGGLPTYSNATHDPSNVMSGDIGAVVTATAANTGGFAGKDHVIVTAHFKDGSSQVVFNTLI